MEKTIQDKLNTAFKFFEQRLAIEYGKQKITYEELNYASDQVSLVLQHYGVKQGTRIGILVENKAKLIVALLGILKANCIFVPLDPQHPDGRLEKITRISNINYLITEEKIMTRASSIFERNMQGRVLSIESIEKITEDVANEPPIYSPDEPIYIYFTSGSTGQPKGILGKNESLLQFINWEIKLLSINENTKVSQLTSPGFDASLRDIFVPLCAGGTICIPESREIILDSLKFSRWLEESKVQVVHCTPSLFNLINFEALSNSSFPALKYILMAGEKIVPYSLKRWYDIIGERIQLVNLYGPTETTMVKMYYFIQKTDLSRNIIPIGKAMPGTTCYILDENLNRCPDGTFGEIYIETSYGTLGYYGNPDLTAERFINHPIVLKKGLLYKTGDLGRILPDGNMEYIGRIDSQVKIRGNRLELGEIENELLSYQGIRQCVVNLRANYKVKGEQHNTSCCKQCGLPSTYPNTVIDADSICNVCKEYDDYKGISDAYFRPINELKEKFDYARNDTENGYDCLLLYSGGKDSTYVLYKLIEIGVRVLTFTFDNGHISKTALQNIDRIVKEHQIDHITGTVDNMSQIFLDGLHEEISVCNGCFKVLSKLSTKIAYEKGIKYIVTGLSRGQIFDLHLYDVLQQSMVQTVEDIKKKLDEKRLLYHSKHDYVSKNLNPTYAIDKNMLEQVELIDFFRYSDVTKGEIIEFLKTKSSYWSNPVDTGFCSSNCLINDVGIYLQRKNKNYDNYTFPNSWEVRTGHISLEESQAESNSHVDELKVTKILNKLGYVVNEERDTDPGCLIAYYIADKTVDNDQLREYLKHSLPDYMIPTHCIPVTSIPLTPNGKVDYLALPEPNSSASKVYIAPRDEIEIKLSEIWRDILGIKKISIDDNFLDIGVHSLNIMTLIARVYEEFEVELPLEEVFNHATIDNIASFIKEKGKGNSMTISAAEFKKYYTLSAAQRRVFTNTQIMDTGNGYNLTTTFVVSGELDIQRLQSAFYQLINRHESLRTSFTIKDGMPVQIIHDHVNFSLPVLELNNRSINELIQECIHVFELEKSPLFQVTLVKIAEQKHILILNFHHIVADGKSVLILQRDLASLYSKKELPKLNIQYKDFAEWQNTMQQSETLQVQEQFWLDSFKKFPPGRGIPTDFPRKKVRTLAGDLVTWEIDQTLCNHLYQIAAEQKTTIFMLLLAAFNVLYSKYAAYEDISIGTPVEGRRYTDIKHVVGMFVNVLAIRSNPSKQKSFRTYLEEIKTITLRSYENQDYQYDMLLKKLNLHTKEMDSQLFNTVFSMLNYEDYTAKVDDITFEYVENQPTEEIYNLRVEIIESPSGFKGSFKYSSELYKKETIEQLVKDYTKILEIIAENLDVLIQDIQLREEMLIPTSHSFSEVIFDF
ncbi:amino acid adenylation domain-containing protein [Paenibacillus sp. LMG 31461]|uniref:Amino acid adenylation domain-containing protein n=1 Tax=Paenibacillus plantarum TaxID=2654975 RepID=A0ABX1X4E8_9BACL|nr:non-ribosomal peptide synthetase [Paenibacillus plantarum]NOU63269.1 amino acid adenylation domain-containing protein [Paenibacillus plantarum]